MRWLIFVLTLGGCHVTDLGVRPFDGPDASAVLPVGEGPFEEPIGFVANIRSGIIVPLDLKHATLLGDQYAAPFLRPRWVATGDQRQLGQIAAWAPADDQVTLFAADLAFNVLLEAPYVVSMDGGQPEIQAVTASDPVFIDADDSGDSARLTDIELMTSYTTTENWTVEYDGKKWWVFGSRSGKQPTTARTGKAYRTENRELAFTIKGSATVGDRFELSTDSGLIEHDLGGAVLGLTRLPGEDVLLAAVWNPMTEQGSVVVWDAPGQFELGRIELPEGAQPWRFAFGANPKHVFVADAHRAAIYELLLDLDLPDTSDLREIPTEGPVSGLAWVSDEGDDITGELAYEHLFVSVAGTNRVDLYDLLDDTWIDVNTTDAVWGGIDLLSPVVGLSPTIETIKLQEESNTGARKEDRVVAVSTFDGSLVMVEGRTGCLAIDVQGARLTPDDTGNYYFTSDRGSDSNPYLYQDPATGRAVQTNGCGGVVRSESWTLTYDGIEGNWSVEGTISGEQANRAWEDQRYVSDEGAISFLVMSGTLPTSDGDTISFSTEDGVLRVDNVLWSKTGASIPLELPAPPLVFDYVAGPSGGGWDPDQTKIFALLPVTNSDIVLRVRLQSWATEVIWQ